MNPKPKSGASRLQAALPVIIVVFALALLAGLAAFLPKAAKGPSIATPTGSAPASTGTPAATLRPTRTLTFTPQPTPTNTFTPLPPIIHTVQKGEVIGAIAKQYGVTIRAILDANGLKDEDAIIRVGQQLIIPRPTPTAQPQATPETPGVTPAVTSASTGAPPVAPGEQVYTVESGDTLSGIAAKFNVTVNLLMSRNNIKDPSLLRAGQTIIIPAGTPTPLPTPTFRPTSTATSGPPYSAPALLWPPSGTVYRGTDKPVLLQWAAVGFLARDEWYVVRVRRGGEVIGEEWTKANAWRLPAELRPAPDAADHRLMWEVLIMRQEGLEPGKGTVIVPARETRWVEWY